MLQANNKDSKGNQKDSSLSRTTDHSQSNFGLTGVNGEESKWNPSGFCQSHEPFIVSVT